MRRVSRFAFWDRATSNELRSQSIGLCGSTEKLERIKHSQPFGSGFRVAGGAFIGDEA